MHKYPRCLHGPTRIPNWAIATLIVLLVPHQRIEADPTPFTDSNLSPNRGSPRPSPSQNPELFHQAKSSSSSRARKIRDHDIAREPQYKEVPLARAPLYASSTEVTYDDKTMQFSGNPNPSTRTTDSGQGQGQGPSSIRIETKPIPFTVTRDKTGEKTNYYSKVPGSPTAFKKKKGEFDLYDCLFAQNCDGSEGMGSLEPPPSSSSLDWDSDGHHHRFPHQYHDDGKPTFLSTQDSWWSGRPGVGTKTQNLKPLPLIILDPDDRNTNSNSGFVKKFGGSARPPLSTRLIRTTTSTSTTSSPENWVKLQPLLPGNSYDPFIKAGLSKTKDPKGSHMNMTSNSFSHRFGEELNPESFAHRHGWSDGKFPNGLRLPGWLEDLNIQHGVKQGYSFESPQQDDDRNWVKLEPIPVSGVTISKWVPKGTSPDELPSTNWPTRNPNKQHNHHSSGSSRPGGPGEHWWDRLDSERRPPPSRPSFIPDPPWPNKGGVGGGSNWDSGNRYGQPGLGLKIKRPTASSWGDVIYPEGPVSATASWEANKHLHTEQLNRLSGSGAGGSSSGSWPSRYPPWSQSSGSKYGGGSGGGPFGSRRPIILGGKSDRPPFYPPDSDQIRNDDSRWVLISSSRGSERDDLRGGGGGHRNQFPYPPPDIDRYDYLSPFEYHNINRFGKELNFTKRVGILKKKKSLGGGSTEPNDLSIMDSTPDPSPESSPASISTTTIRQRGHRPGRPHHIVHLTESSDMKKFIEASSIPLATTKRPTTTSQRSILGGMNPVLAAVGAGMIPASLAAVFPVAIGRRRKKRSVPPSPIVRKILRLTLPRPYLMEKDLAHIKGHLESEEIVERVHPSYFRTEGRFSPRIGSIGSLPILIPPPSKSPGGTRGDLEFRRRTHRSRQLQPCRNVL